MQKKNARNSYLKIDVYGLHMPSEKMNISLFSKDLLCMKLEDIIWILKWWKPFEIIKLSSS